VLAAAEPLHNVLSTISDNPTPEGQLTTPFVGLMRKIYRSQSQQALNPKELYNTFVKKYTYFKPYTQQDAQEFMRFLLEGLKSEVPPPPAPDSMARPNMKRTRRRTLVMAGTEDSESHDKSANNETQQTYIDQLFGGKLASYVVCDVCKSVTFPRHYDAHRRYRRAMRIFKTSHYQSMMPIHLTCVNAIDFEHNSSEQIPLVYSTNTSTLNQHPQSVPTTKKTPEAWLPMSAATYPLAATSNPVTTPNAVVSTKAIVKKSLWAENSQNYL
jgi:Ubiquitin carboxyl-terminal hydrolase